MKSFLAMSFVILTGCATVQNPPVSFSYPCTQQNPCAISTAHSMDVLLRGQMHTCGGTFKAESIEPMNGQYRLRAKCTQCGKEVDFFFTGERITEDDGTLLAAFRHAAQLIQDGMAVDAIPWIEDLIQREPLFVGARLLLTEALLSTGQIDQAKSALAGLESVTKSHPELYRLRAELEIALGDAEAYQKDIELYSQLFQLQIDANAP
ncbi:MAG TPA: tetratricopeptide repeat protein [Thermoanaerobaculia bacterium]|nr:tetratricopeptide repeat protein [Thermoanaerobaculia bacterium]HUM30560.1 tetratricopeptide repeat protein [Thermoanaerobaculia bacterium]HXK68752.1 tetratricopeptide repeat protein [Thermoanaerobaculia bacterium]